MTTFHIQPASSHVSWTGKKVLGLHTGSIGIAGGQLELDNGTIKGGTVVIDMASLAITDIPDPKTHQEFKDHLFHDDFFAIDKFPHARLVISQVNPAGNNRHTIAGVLTIKEISHPVSYESTVEVFTDTLHALGTITIDRTLYNIRYGSGKFIQNLGNKLIYDDFVIQFKLVAERTPPSPSMETI